MKPFETLQNLLALGGSTSSFCELLPVLPTLLDPSKVRVAEKEELQVDGQGDMCWQGLTVHSTHTIEVESVLESF